VVLLVASSKPCQAEKRREQFEKRFGITLPPNWEPPSVVS
jgi:hypothetical protein